MADEVDAANALAQHRQSQPSGTLRVSMTNDIAESLLAPMLSRFVERHPQVQLQLDLTARRVDLIGEGFDLALRWGDLRSDAALVARRVCTMRVGLYAAPAYLARRAEPKAPADLLILDALQLLGHAGEPWILQTGPAAHESRWQGLPPVRAAVNSTAVLLQLAANGLGVVATADWTAAPYVARGAAPRTAPLVPAAVPGWCCRAAG